MLSCRRIPAVLATAAASVLALTLAPPAATAQPSVDAAATVHTRQAAMNAGDAAAAVALFADSAVWIRSSATDYCSRQTPCIGGADILNGINEQLADGICYTQLGCKVLARCSSCVC
jgi:streptogramin lyase